MKQFLKQGIENIRSWGRVATWATFGLLVANVLCGVSEYQSGHFILSTFSLVVGTLCFIVF